MFLGYARSKLSHEDLVKHIEPNLKVCCVGGTWVPNMRLDFRLDLLVFIHQASSEDDKALVKEFLKKCEYIQGAYDEAVCKADLLEVAKIFFIGH